MNATSAKPRVRYTRESLEHAVDGSTTLQQVVEALGLEDSPYRRRYVSQKLREFGLDCGRLRGSHHRFPPELLAQAAAVSVSIRGVVRFLQARPVGGTEAHVGRLLKKHGIDTSHFTGARHNRGSRSPRRRSAQSILVKNADDCGRTPARLLRRALCDIGVEPRCAGCGIGPEWQGRLLTLEIDHVNGDLTDNRRENLQYLCPNCHATTDSYCRRKRRTLD
ncbi:MAG: HNH endonuclease [Actinocrinis sp.]